MAPYGACEVAQIQLEAMHSSKQSGFERNVEGKKNIVETFLEGKRNMLSAFKRKRNLIEQ